MEFISKNNQANILPIYTNFEKEAWNEEDQKYHGYEYNGLPKDVKIYLIDEQNDLCCYCLVKLENNSSTTLEHVFPQKPGTTDLLANYNVKCIDSRVFDYKTRNIPIRELTNLPHDISYYNLIASCNSKNSCNNIRGNAIIRPFFFDSDIKNQFSYNDDGEIFSEKYETEISILGLSNTELIKYRKLWKYIKRKNTPLLFASFDELKTQIKIEALELGINEDDSFFEGFIEENEQKLLKAIKYKYFYT